MNRALVLMVLAMACDKASGPAPVLARQSVCGTSATAETKKIYDGLKGECAGCHVAGVRSFFVSLGTFQALLVTDEKLVKPGDPDNSELIKLLEGHGTGVFKQMPIAGLAYADRASAGTAVNGVSMSDVRAWVTNLATQSRDPRPDPNAKVLVRMTGQQAQRTLYQQLGLDNSDFYIKAFEYDVEMAEKKDEDRYPLLGPDEMPAPRQSQTAERFYAIGGGSSTGQIRADSTVSPTYVLTMQQTSQAWCRFALGKTGNTALFSAGSMGTADEATAKTTIRRWGLHFIATQLSDDEVNALYTDLFVPLVADSNAGNAYVGLCSYFIRHPLWVFY